MPVNVDRLGRMINNLYTRVFEQGAGQVGQNAVFRYAQTNRENPVGARGDAGWVREIMRDGPLAFARFQDDLDTWWTTGAVGAKALSNRGTLALNGNFGDYAGLTKLPGNVVDGTLLDSGVYKFDFTASTSNYITLAYRQQSSLIFEFVVNNVVANSSNLQLLKIINNGGAYCALEINTSGQLSIDFNGGETQVGGSGLLTGRHHIAWVLKPMFSASWMAVSLYLDGVQVFAPYRPNTSWSISNLGTDTYTFLQQSSGAGGKSIEIDELVVYGTRLSDARIAAHAAAILNRSSTYPTSAAESYVVPPARYYQTLTQPTGSNLTYDTSGWGFSDGTTASVRVAYPGGGIGDPTQMWAVFRVLPDYGASDNVSTNAGYLFNWTTGVAGNLIRLEYVNGAPGNWVLTRQSASAGAGASVAATHSIYQGETVAFAVTSTQVKVGKAGTFGTPVGNTAIPSLAGFDIEMGNISGGTAAQAFGANRGSFFQWVIMGTGTITDTEFTALHNIGDADPQWWEIPNILTLDVSFMWHCRSLEHTPTGVWGESNYG